MTILTVIVITVLVLIGLVHFYWAFGGTVGMDKALPSINGKSLINPGKPLTFFVGMVMLGFSTVAYILQFYDVRDITYGDYIVYLGWMVSGIFILRAIGEFNTVGFFKKIRSSEFAIYDTKYYSPLCLFIGSAFTVLTYSQM